MSKALARNANLLGGMAGLILVAIVGLLTYLQIVSDQAAGEWVRHTYQVISESGQLDLAVRDAETGQRGFLLTGQDAYLAPYHDALERIALIQSELVRLTADNPAQQARLRRIAGLVRQKLDELSQTIRLRQDDGLDAALAIVRTNRGEVLMQEITAVLGEVTAEEEHLLDQRRQEAAAADARARWIAGGGMVLGLAMLGSALFMLARAREELAQSAAAAHLLATQIRTAFDSLSQGVAVFDAAYLLARWNDGFCALLDLPRPLVRQGTPYAAVAAQAAAPDRGKGLTLESEAQIRHGGETAREPGAPVIYHGTRTADGRSFEFRRTFMPDGGFVLTVTDTTEQTRAEAAARDAQRLQAMGQLTGGIAHDFNNLLTVVLGSLELAAARLQDGHPVLALLDRAAWAARRGATLNQQLLAFARRQPLAPVPTDVSAMLPDLTTLLHRTLGEHIEVRTVDSAGLWQCPADSTQLESAVLNLALNARDAMQGGGRLTIEVANKVLDAAYASQHSEVSPGDYVMIAVSDTGSGMPPEVQARAFEPFFTTKEQGRGTGLGLAMVLGFAKQSGGHVKIYSEQGEGTTVRLYLPRAVGAALPAQQRARAPVELPQGSGTVLVVEDDPHVRELTTTMLRQLGYQVLQAADGPEALRVFGENGARVDLLLVDVVLPRGMKGDEVSRRLTAICPGLRTLFMSSGYTENAIVHHGRLDDGVHLINKPFSSEALARKVADVLGLASEERLEKRA
ncbi:MAG TPA: CHASE3 domain-containing protein [Acetobacteraceae bacterium]|nr:CHASE3 domain-containing protein [Acetobacteraceae bacterium]